MDQIHRKSFAYDVNSNDVRRGTRKERNSERGVGVSALSVYFLLFLRCV